MDNKNTFTTAYMRGLSNGIDKATYSLQNSDEQIRQPRKYWSIKKIADTQSRSLLEFFTDQQGANQSPLWYTNLRQPQQQAPSEAMLIEQISLEINTTSVTNKLKLLNQTRILNILTNSVLKLYLDTTMFYETRVSDILKLPGYTGNYDDNPVMRFEPSLPDVIFLRAGQLFKFVLEFSEDLQLTAGELQVIDALLLCVQISGKSFNVATKV